MRYLILLQSQNGMSGFVQNSYDEAVNYIRESINLAGSNIQAVSQPQQNQYSVMLGNGTTLNIGIYEYTDDVIKYDVETTDEGRTCPTMRFASRESALQYVGQTLQQRFNTQSTPGSAETGQWTALTPSGLYCTFKLTIALLDGPEEVGKEFSRNKVASYLCMDLKYMFMNVNSLNVNNTPNPAVKKGNPTASIVSGALLLALGVIMTAVSYSSAAEGGRYTIFTGLIIVGIIDLALGIFQYFKNKGA